MGSMGLGQAAPSIPVIATGRAAAATLYEIIDAKSPIDALSDDGVRLKKDGNDGVTGKIELRNVHFHYDTNASKKILNDCSLVIPAGHKVALVGASGTGLIARWSLWMFICWMVHCGGDRMRQ